MTREETAKLQHIVDRYVVLNNQIKTAQDEQKELAQAAYDGGLVRVSSEGDARKVVKKLAKESGWDELQRMAQRQLEESLDECRAALGLLADLPLGQAAQNLAKEIRNGELDMKIGDDPWLSEQMDVAGTQKHGPEPGEAAQASHAGNGNGHGEPEKRGRGRPKGSRNKPKAAPAVESYVPPPPPIPDWPQ